MNDLHKSWVENSPSFLCHWKYIKKVPVGSGYRYFYSQDEYDAFLKGDKSNNKSTVAYDDDEERGSDGMTISERRKRHFEKITGQEPTISDEELEQRQEQQKQSKKNAEKIAPAKKMSKKEYQQQQQELDEADNYGPAEEEKRKKKEKRKKHTQEFVRGYARYRIGI